MSGRIIKFNEPYITGNEIDYIKEVFKNNHFQGNGPFTKKVQSLLESYLGVKKVLLTDSCTSALEISALLLKQTDNDEVILPSYTFSSTASAFARAGYKLVFADVDPNDMMISSNSISEKITVNTRVIVPVHYAGLCSDLDPILKLAEAANVDIVEDAAQALGSTYKGQKLGTIGRLGCFSFHETKNIHAGLAGALIINDESLIERATYVWERGTNREAVLNGVADKYTWVEIGGSFYPTELQAAFLLAQLESLDVNLSERKKIYNVYSDNLAGLKMDKSLHFPEAANNQVINYHAFFIVLKSEKECDYVREYLLDHKVSAYIGYVPLHSSPVGIKMGNSCEDLPITEEYSRRVLRLPLHNNMSVEDAENICSYIKEACQHGTT